MVHLWLGETNDHQTLCRKLVELAANSTDPTAHDRAAKAYLVQAHPDPELLKQAVASGRQPLKLAGANDGNRGLFLSTAAMAEVRDGRPGEAESLLSQALAISDGGNERRGLALAYRALARARLNHRDEARADLAELEALLPAIPAPPAASAICFNADSMAAVLAREEARARLHIPATTSKP